MSNASAAVLIMALIVFAVIMVVGILAESKQKRAKKDFDSPPPPPPARQTSALAGFSFFFGLVAILMVTASAITKACVSMNEVTGIPEAVHSSVDLAARIVLYVSLLPSVGAIALGLAARGSINES